MHVNSNDARSSVVRIADREVGPGRPCLIVAEIGNNHNGDFERAIALVDLAAAASADCAKFQMRKLDEVYRASSLAGSGEDLSVEYTLDLLRRFELTTDQHRRLKEYCDRKGILYMCTPWDLSSARSLAAFPVAAFKVASADLTNLPLLGALCETGKPLIASTGMSTLSEIEAVVAFLNERHAQFALLHCQSTYPAAFHNINLRFMERLRQVHPIIGYSGHERGIAITIGAVARGACIVERHITLDRTMEGPDHAASLEAAEFGALVQGIREIEAALGEETVHGERPLSQGELINRENLAKSLVAARDLAQGTTIAASDVLVRSPGQGLSPLSLPRLLGRTTRRHMRADDYFFASDLADQSGTARRYRFHQIGRAHV